MLQKTALQILKTGVSVFLTGEPGSGKSYTVKKYIEYLKSNDIIVSITASTGIAASQIGGMTIHSFSGIGIKDSLSLYDLENMLEKENLVKRIRKTRVLIIDEISMLSPNTLDMIDMVFRHIRSVSKPFGGVQVILVGDFFQLPPVFKKEEKVISYEIFEEIEGDYTLCYESKSFKELKPIICYLTEQYRQEDQDFLNILKMIREGYVDESVHKTLKKRILEKKGITKIYTHNIHVDKVNYIELNNIKGNIRIFEMQKKGKTIYTDTLIKNCLSPEKLELKIGAKIMTTKNNSEKGFVNGSVGKVKAFNTETGYPLIEFQDKKIGKLVEITPMDWSIEENGKIIASITQIPLRLAWAITVHKSQGMSLDEAMMDLSNVFEFGQGYVALSRVKTLKGLYLVDYNQKSLEVNPRIIEKDKEFRTKSHEADEYFKNLSNDELNKLQTNFIK